MRYTRGTQKNSRRHHDQGIRAVGLPESFGGPGGLADGAGGLADGLADQQSGGYADAVGAGGVVVEQGSGVLPDERTAGSLIVEGGGGGGLPDERGGAGSLIVEERGGGLPDEKMGAGCLIVEERSLERMGRGVAPGSLVLGCGRLDGRMGPMRPSTAGFEGVGAGMSGVEGVGGGRFVDDGLRADVLRADV